MNFLFEDINNLSNFINNKDINRSGIPRFAISPLFTSTQIYVNANNKNSEFRILPSTDEVDGYVISSCVNHSPDDWTGYDPKVKSLFSYLNEKYLKDLRENRGFLMLDQSLEGYQTPWLWDWFHSECKSWEISPKRIIYVTGNMIADTVYEKWCEENRTEERMKIIPYPHFELDMGMTTWGRNKENSEKKLPSFSQNINYKIQNPNQLKTYTCLNKRIRPHRVWFYYYLFNSGLLNEGLVSMNEFDKHWYNWEGKHFEDGELDECSEILPLLVYDTPNNVLDDNIYINRFPEQVVKDTFFTVVSEAHCGDWDQTMFLSEKTFKVIGCRHPFLIMGNKNSMEMMRKIGYKTFDGFIDEGFDNLPTHERLNYIIESIRKVTNIKDKIEWYKSMEEIIEYNYNTLIDKLFRYPDAYIEMKNYCQITGKNKICCKCTIGKKNRIKIDENSKIVIGLGDSFTQGEGACELKIWEKYSWDLKKMSDQNNRLEINESNLNNSWVHQLCNNYLTDFTPINMGMTGKGNRGAIKELYLHPDLNIEKAKEKIVILMLTGFERIDFIFKKFYNHLHFYTWWGINNSTHEHSDLWKLFFDYVYSDRSALIEMLMSIAELNTWCKLNNATLIITSAFRPEYNREYIFNKIRGDYTDFMNESEEYIYGLVDIVDWENFFRPGGFRCITDYLLHLEGREDLILEESAAKYYEFGSSLDKLSPNGYITKCSHPSYNGHDKIAKLFYEHIIKIKPELK